MKRVICVVAALALGTAALGCKKKEETPEQKAKGAISRMTDAAGKAVSDAGKAVSDAGKAAKEAAQ